MKSVFTIKDALIHGWKKLSENFWFLILLTLVFFVLSALFDKSKGAHQPMDVLLNLVSIIVSYFAMFSFVRFGLKISKGQKPFWNDLFNFKGILFWYYVLASLVYTIGNTIGLLLVIIPGIILIIRLGFFGFILVEEEKGPIESLKKSWAITKGHFWHLLGFSVIMFLINVVGILAFVFGLLVTAPFTLLATVYVYEKLKAGAHHTHETHPAQHAPAHQAEHTA